MSDSYPLATSTWGVEEYQAISRVISSGKFTMGDEVKQFELKFARHFKSRHGVMSNSGSSANLLAIGAIKYGRPDLVRGRDEVIVPAVSWSTTYFPLTQLGFRLRFVDIDLDTLNASPEAIAQAVGKRTAGLMVVNLLGNPSKLSQIRSLADERSLFMVEDNCESMGATLEGQFAGTFGHVGTFSTFFSHHISTMEGGVTVTNHVEIDEAMRSLRAHGWIRDLPQTNTVHTKVGDEVEDSFKFALPGYNLRPLEMEGAIGRSQLDKLDAIVRGRRSNARLFKERIAKYPEVLTQTETGDSSWFGFSLVLTGRLSGRRRELIRLLRDEKVDVRPIVAGNFAKNPVMAHVSHAEIPDLRNADKVHDDGLFVGNHHYEMSQEFDRLERALDAFVK